jgi:hypothetical protein
MSTVGPPSKPVTSMSKIEMEAKIKAYKFVLFKLHKEIESKDEQIASLTRLLEKAQKRQG